MSLPVAIDYTAALTQGGGIGRYTRELVNALSSEDTLNHYLLFVAGKTDNKLPDPPGKNFSWRTSRLGQEWFARIWHRAHIPVPIEHWTGRIALLHAPDFTLPPTRNNTRTLLTVHDLSFLRTPETAAPQLRAYLSHVVPLSVARADHILADSEATRQDLILLYGTPEGKISVLYSGVNDHFRRIEDADRLEIVRSRYGIDARPYILSVGTVQPRKNYERLVKAFSCLGYPDIQLVIAGGKGWLDDPFYQCIQSLGLRDQVKITGFVQEEDLPALYSGAQAFAFPSLYEGFGLPPLEAMACGVPTVVANVSSLPEVVGDAALLIDPYSAEELTEALRVVLTDVSIRQMLITRGYKRARKFTWRAAAQQLCQHYKNLLAV